jgi:protein SCO1/2
VQVQGLLGERVGTDVFLVSISLDPEHDTPEVLARYAKRFGAKRGWTFLTGDPDDVDLLRRKFGLYDPDPVIDADKTQHAGLLIYGSEPAGRWGAIPVDDSLENIVRALTKVMPPRADSSKR